MSLSLWMLLAFAGWTLLVLLVGVGVYRWSLILTGRAALVSFPGDTPHGAPIYRRATRAHVNCLESLPIFGVIVFIATTTGVTSPTMDALSIAMVISRVAQTLIHVSWVETNRTVAWRFSFFTVQAVAMIAMGALIVTSILTK
jgi:uncharacterized MAPEG superfamily protein